MNRDDLLRMLGTTELKLDMPVGDYVECDFCGTDLTSDERPGGFLFQSKGVGPCCKDKMLARIKGYGEESYIRAHAPDDVPFADWIREMRGPDAAFRVYGASS